MLKRDARPEVKNLRLSLRLSDRERALWQEAADADGRSLGDFIRHSTSKAATSGRRLREHGGTNRYLDAKRAGDR